MRELQAFPARYLIELPSPLGFSVQAHGIPTDIDLMTARLAYGDEPLRGIVFDADELAALVLGVENERVRPAEFKGFCLHKLQDPGFRLTPELALDGAFAQSTVAGAAAPTLSLGQVLRGLELRLVSAHMLCDRDDRPAGHGPSEPVTPETGVAA